MFTTMKEFGTWSVLLLVSACSGPSNQGSEASPERIHQAYQSPYQLYLRCNATSWELNTASKLQPTADPYLFALDFEVTQPWMVSDRDTCWVTDATSGYTDYGASNATAIPIPS